MPNERFSKKVCSLSKLSRSIPEVNITKRQGKIKHYENRKYSAHFRSRYFQAFCFNDTFFLFQIDTSNMYLNDQSIIFASFHNVDRVAQANLSFPEYTPIENFQRTLDCRDELYCRSTAERFCFRHNEVSYTCPYTYLYAKF